MLEQVFPHIAPVRDALAAACHKHGIDTVNRQAAFLSQCGHESMGFARLTENLNYSAAGLRGTWPHRFSGGIADRYAHNPEAIANHAYCDRNGNGNEASGDGWKFRGRGFIQVTGRANYVALALYLERNLDDTVAYLETPEGAAESAAWFWSCHNLNDFADAGNVLAITRAINGGTNGLQERATLYASTRAALTKDCLL
jgi:putative chitinase